MSGWAAYSQQAVDTGFFEKATILGAGDGSTWGESKLTLKAGEGAKIANLFKTPANAFAEGIFVDGVKYLAVKSEGNSIYGKKGNSGVVCVKTNTAILVGVYPDGKSPGGAANAMEKVGDGLRDQGY